MAGRAGRRGKDTQGLVLYEPMRDPVDLGELQGMVCGALPRLESRMRFHYDFLLRRALTAGSSSVAEESYWAAQQREAREALRADAVVATAAAEAAAAAVTEAESALIAEHTALERAIVTSKNAAQRRARTALDRWLTDNGGPQWAFIKGKGARREETAARAATLTAEVARWDAAPLLSTGGMETCLVRWGFLTAEGGLTPRGLLATDVNEGHPILMPLLADSGRVAALRAEELPCILAAFIREGGGGRPEEAPTLDAACLRAEALGVLTWLDGEVGRFQREEDAAGVLSPPDFWDLSALWVCVVARWQAGAGLPVIAAEFGLFEGNVQRGLLKVANLLEEWAVLCELRRDLEGLERVRGLRFLREELVVDSLYLRL
jgi:hypothetical protein